MNKDYKEEYEEQIALCFEQLVLIAVLSLFMCVGFVASFFLFGTGSVIDIICMLLSAVFVVASGWLCVNSIIELVGMWKEEKDTIKKEIKK